MARDCEKTYADCLTCESLAYCDEWKNKRKKEMAISDDLVFSEYVKNRYIFMFFMCSWCNQKKEVTHLRTCSVCGLEICGDCGHVEDIENEYIWFCPKCHVSDDTE